MPGFVGVWGSGATPSPSMQQAAIGPLRHDKTEVVRTVTTDRLWLATVAPQDRQILLDEEDGDLLLVWGEMFGDGDNRLSACEIRSVVDHPGSVRPGCYAILSASPRDRTLTLATDACAARPIYYHTVDNRILFATAPSAVAAIVAKSPEPDLEAWFDLMLFSTFTGELTPFRGIHHLPPASYLRTTLRGSDLRVTPGQMARDPLPPLVRHRSSLDQVIGHFNELVRQAVSRAVGKAPRVAVMTSGGLDSRLVWAAMSKEDRDLIGLSFGPTNLPDVMVAEALCARLGIPYRRMEIAPAHIRTLAGEVVRLTDGSVSFIHQVANLLVARDGPDTDVILDGGQGWVDIVPPQAWAWDARALVTHELLHGGSDDWLALLTPEIGSSFLEHREARTNEFCRLADTGSVHDRLLRLDGIHRRRHMQANLLKLGQREAYSPLFDSDVHRVVAALPGRWRFNKIFQARAICAMAPALGELVWTETGYPLRSLRGSLSVYLQKLRQRIAPTPLYDRGHRLFDLYDGWMRNELVEWLQAVFSAKTELTNRLFRPGAATALLDAHRRHGGKAEMLSRLCTIYLWAEQDKKG